MSLLSRLFKKSNGDSEPVTSIKAEPTLSPEGLVVEIRNNSTGGNPSREEATKLEAVFTCLKLRSEAIGCLPMKMYTVTSDGIREPKYSGREHRIYTKRPNDFQTFQEFMEFGVWSLDRNGAFYALKVKNDRGSIMELIPFRYQDSVRPMMDDRGDVYYHYVTNDNKPVTTYHHSDMFIIKGITRDGVIPISPLIHAGEVLGVAKSQESTFRDAVENGITSQMALATDNVFNDPNAVERLKADWGSQSIRGAGGRKKVPLLENGTKPISLKLTPQEADILKSREFTIDRICNFLGVQPQLVGSRSVSSSKVTLREVNEMFMMRNLNPVIVKFENAFNELLPDSLSVKIDRKQFYAGSPLHMSEAVGNEVKMGLCTVNEGRMDLGRDPVAGGDVFAIDTNNLTFGTWDKLPSMVNKPDDKEVTQDEQQ